MEFVKIGALAVLGVLLGIQFKGGRQEYAAYIGLAVSLMIFSWTAAYMGGLVEQLSGMQHFFAAGSRHMGLLFKVVGITWLCEFVAGICRDNGFSAVASQIELLGKMAVLFAGMPVFLALIETIAGFAG